MAETWISRPSAEEMDAAAVAGAHLPLAGLHFAVKDNIDVAGVPTTAACEAFAHIPERSADAVQRLLDAGAVYAGKTNLDQFATGLVGTRSPRYGACRNPIIPEYIAGGSSSGSAIAVATGEVTFALGTDTAGSGRVPAALCGVVGLKPTPGIVSTHGVVPAMASYDCVSVFATTVGDAVSVFRALGGRGDAEHPPFTRLGVFDDLEWFGDDDARDQFEKALVHARALGCTVTEVDATPFRAAGALLYGSALVAERHTAFGDFAAAHPDAMDPAVAEIVRRAGEYPATDVFRALATLAALRDETMPTWRSIDALLLPTVARVPTFSESLADPFGPSQELGRLTAFVNPLGLAAVAVPFGIRASGVPFGVSVIGPGGSDAELLALAARFTGESLPATAVDLSTRPHRLAVVGAHLTGQPLNHQLTDLGAVWCATTTTAPGYRLFALDTTPPKPGLLRAPGAGGAIEVEVWALDAAGLGAFVAAIPAPLGVGKVELADGSEVTGFLCEPHATEHAQEITAYGGWRAFLAAN
jgi:allophanate hydrolase